VKLVEILQANLASFLDIEKSKALAVKFNANQLKAFFKKLDPTFKVVLFFGPDQGLVHERTKTLIKLVVSDIHDPFLISELTGKQIISDPGRLIDETMAQSMVGGERIVWIKLGSEDISKTIENYLKTNNGGSLVVIEAGDINIRSPLRKIIENNKIAIAAPCYMDNQKTITTLIDQVLNVNNKKITNDARIHLIESLGSDHLISRTEIEKLIVYSGENENILLSDVKAIIGDSGAISIEEICYCTGEGNIIDLERNLSRAFAEGINSITVLRSVMRHFLKLHLVASQLNNSGALDQSIKLLKPPIVFLFLNRFKNQIALWSINNLERALQLLQEAEIECKSTGYPVNSICSRTLIRIAQRAKD